MLALQPPHTLGATCPLPLPLQGSNGTMPMWAAQPALAQFCSAFLLSREVGFPLGRQAVTNHSDAGCMATARVSSCHLPSPLLLKKEKPASQENSGGVSLAAIAGIYSSNLPLSSHQCYAGPIAPMQRLPCVGQSLAPQCEGGAMLGQGWEWAEEGGSGWDEGWMWAGRQVC